MSFHYPLFNYVTYSNSDELRKVTDIPITKSNNLAVNGEYFPIKFDISKKIRIQRYLEQRDSKIQDIILRATDLSLEERNHLLYLLLSLDAYYKQKIYVMRRRDLIPLIMTEDGLKTLKRLRLLSFLHSNQGYFCSIPEWFNTITPYRIYDIGEIFNYNYGMYWEVQDSKDYLISQEPVEKDKAFVKLFERVTERLIHNSSEFEEVKPLEILLRVSTSQAMDNDGKSIPHYSLKSQNLHFSEKRSEGKRVMITTGPGQGRDAILNKVNDLNTIQLINENIRNFLKVNFKEFLLLNTSEENKRKFFKTCNKFSNFFCRDIQKEGLTKPKYLTKIILSALQRRFPKNLAFRFPSFYLGPWFEGDNGQRGHGLGMANELTTLMQIIIFYCVNEYLGEEGYYVSSERAFYLNDDAVVFVNGSQDDLDDYINADFSVCEGLGIKVQRDKSIYSQQCAIFCEMYYSRGCPFVNDKESYILRESNIMSKCSNILEAKFYAGNMKGSLSSIENLLLQTFAFLGYEFSKDEINWPIPFGGLRPFKLRGTDFSLNYLNEYQDLRVLWKAYQANKERKLWSWNKFLKTYTPPIVKLFPSVITEKEERILDKLTISSNYNLSSTFFRPTKEHKFYRSIRKLYRKREAIFNSISTFPTLEIFCEDYSSQSNSNVALPEQFYERYIKVKLFVNKRFKDPYLVINPITSYLNTLDRFDKTIPATAWGLFQSEQVVSAEKSVFARNRTLNTLSLIDRFEEDLDISILIFPENDEDIEDFMESYPKPFLAYELVKFGNQLPIPKQKFRNPDLKLRKQVFGKYLNFRELTLSQLRTWHEMMSILKFEEIFKDYYEFEDDFWDVVFRQLKEEKESSSSEEKSSDSDDYNPPGDPIYLDHDGVEVIEEEAIEKIIPSATESEEESQEIVIPSAAESEEEELLQEEVNPFLKPNPLPDGDISVYGSEEWVKWFVNEDTRLIEEYCESDSNLSYACIDVIAFRNGFIVSNLFDEHNNTLKQNVIVSAERSWIAHYYVSEIFDKKTEEDDPLEINLF
jgi:hypothetical protein